MSTVADIIHAIDEEGSTSWQIADQVAELDELDDDGKPLTLKAVADRIWTERGVEWAPTTLGRYRSTALAFPTDIRMSVHPFAVHMELRAHPDKLRDWKPTKDGDVLTVERARALRGGGSARKAKPDAWKAQVDRALGVIATAAEHDPAAVIEMLSQTIATLERNYPKVKRELRAV